MSKVAPTCAVCGDDCKGELCKRCQSSRYYWKDATPAKRMARRGKLELYSNRMNYFFPKDVKK